MVTVPRYIGFIEPPYVQTFTDTSGAPLDLSGCVSDNFTLTLLNTATGQAKHCTGLWTVANQSANKGQASYGYMLADVDTVGLWYHYATVKLPSETGPREMDPEPVQFLAGTVGAGAAPAGVLPNPAPSLPFLNIRDFGGIGDGISDNTTPIFDARAAARALGGAIIVYGPGVFLSGNQDISNDPYVYHVGSGRHTTIIKLKNGANAPLFDGNGSVANLAAANSSGPRSYLYDFGFSNMTLDGNKANQTGGPSYPIRVHAYGFHLNNVIVRNGYSGNILADYHGGDAPGGPYPSGYLDELAPFDQWSNVMCYGSGGVGIALGGPNDSQWSNVYSFLDASHNLQVGPNAPGLTTVNMHLWSPGNWYNPPSDNKASDTFHRANQLGWGTATSGDVWATDTSHYAISSNVGTANDSAGNHIILGSQTLADIDMTALINQEDDGNFVAPLWRYVDGNNFYDLGRFGGSLFLEKYVAGVKTGLASANISSIPVTHDAYYRIQMIGTTIKVKYWDAANSEPYTWLMTVTDSSLTAAGKFGMNTFSPVTAQVKSFTVAIPHVYTNAVSFLCEAWNTMCSNCTAESSDTVQIAVLASNFHWAGGAVYDAFPGFSSGIKIGQQAGETPFPGQINQSGGLTTPLPVGNARIDTEIRDCTGPNGALWLDADGGGNDIHATFFQNKGQFVSGTLAASTRYTATPGTTIPTSDGTIYTSAWEQTASPVRIQSASTLYSGSGVPSNTLGNNGDFWFRTDTPGTTNQRLYVKSAGAWIGML